MIRRRTFVARSGLVLLGLKFGLLTGCDGGSPALELAPDDPGSAAALLEIAGRMSGVDFVGPHCRSLLAPDDPAAELLARLQTTGAASLGEALERAMGEDFESGKLREIGGWMLSETECRLAALAADIQGLAAPAMHDSSALRPETFVDVVDWGPTETYEGQVFNRQPDGGGGFWVRIDSHAPGSTRLTVDGEVLRTHVGGGVVTAGLGPEEIRALIDHPGTYKIALLDQARGLVQHLGEFTVRPATPAAILEHGRTSAVFCEIENWGPRETAMGQSFNEQPDGRSGLWIRTGCAPDGTRLELGEYTIPARVRPGFVTGLVDFHAEIQRGVHPLWLVDPESGERLRVGEFTVR